MVVLVPLLKGERIRKCSRCSHLGIESPHPERSSYYRKQNGQFAAACRRCDARRSRVWRDAHRQERREYQREWARRKTRRERKKRVLDPAAAAAEASRRKAARKAWRDRPEVKKRNQENQRRYQERIRQDPERLKRIRELARINHRLRRERAGFPLADPGPDPRARCGLELPVGPLRAILDETIAAAERDELAIAEVAEWTGVPERRIYDIRYVRSVVDADVVDQVLTALDLDDPYPAEVVELAQEARALQRKRARAPARTVCEWIGRVVALTEGMD